MQLFQLLIANCYHAGVRKDLDHSDLIRPEMDMMPDLLIKDNQYGPHLR